LLGALATAGPSGDALCGLRRSEARFNSLKALLDQAASDLVVTRAQGLYCPPGDFYIDPWQPVSRALITHAHGDHLRAGHAHYMTSEAGRGVVLSRVGPVDLQTLPYGEKLKHQGVTISFHPAGHVLGSAQIRLEHEGRVWVVSGDYKTGPDPTCPPFEPVRCDVFITESTFGLPVFRWAPQQDVFDDINAWWSANADAGRASVVYAYSFGKAQRVLAGLDARIGTVIVHGAVATLNVAYRAAGVALPPTRMVVDATPQELRRCIVIAPPSTQGSAWLKRFGDASDAFASGWMQLRGARRRRNVDRGFVLSDHADWPGLLGAIRATQAPRVIVTHGYVEPLVRYLAEQGWQSGAFKTEYGDDEEQKEADASPSSAASAPGTETDDAPADAGDDFPDTTP
jgi:putative mRNA 3-end processing factor